MIDWAWNYGIPIFLTCCASAGLLAFSLALFSDTTINPIQYLRNYLNARKMKRERESMDQDIERIMALCASGAAGTIAYKEYHGKVFPPRGIFSFDDPETSLELRLRIAIENEDYEEAARLRDEIKKQEDANN